jgi:penicillin-binding protein 2
MERVVMDNAGTGTRARVGRFRIAGKTGTAQNPHGNDHAVFACFATVDDPRLAVAVIAEESGHGGSVAAPVAQRVLQVFLTGSLPEDAAGAGDWDAVGVEGD